MALTFYAQAGQASASFLIASGMSRARPVNLAMYNIPVVPHEAPAEVSRGTTIGLVVVSPGCH